MKLAEALMKCSFPGCPLAYKVITVEQYVRHLTDFHGYDRRSAEEEAHRERKETDKTP